MTDLRDGETPNAGVSLAGEIPSERAKAATDGVERKRGDSVVSGSGPDGAPSGRGPASISASKEAGAAPVGRRRRRRRKTANKSDFKNGPLPAAKAQSGSAPSAPAGGHDDGQGETQGGKPAEKKGRRRRRKSGREIQGRPLAPQKAPGLSQQVAHAAAAGQAHTAAAPAVKGVGAESPALRRPVDDLYAALDLGTNNCRLLIAQPTRPGQFRVVDAFSASSGADRGGLDAERRRPCSLDEKERAPVEERSRILPAEKLVRTRLPSAFYFRLIGHRERCPPRWPKTAREFLDSCVEAESPALEAGNTSPRETESPLAVARQCFVAFVGRVTPTGTGGCFRISAAGRREIAMIDPEPENRTNMSITAMAGSHQGLGTSPCLLGSSPPCIRAP